MYSHQPSTEIYVGTLYRVPRWIPLTSDVWHKSWTKILILPKLQPKWLRNTCLPWIKALHDEWFLKHLNWKVDPILGSDSIRPTGKQISHEFTSTQKLKDLIHSAHLNCLLWLYHVCLLSDCLVSSSARSCRERVLHRFALKGTYRENTEHGRHLPRCCAQLAWC